MVLQRLVFQVVAAHKDIQNSLHQCQKPVEACEYFIKTYTNPGDLVLDSCAGSCTTAVAALNTDRNYICFEKDKDIFEVGSKRVTKYAHQDLLMSVT